MAFDIENFKNNKKLLSIMLVFIVLLVLLNGLLGVSTTSEAKLEDKEIEISKLVINEIMTSNKGVFIDPTGNTYDWLELYNGSDKDIDLTNYGLSDKDDGSVKWLFPNIIIPKESYLVVYLPGEKLEGLYAAFSLKAEGGETITLKKPNGKVVDTVKTVKLDKNNVMARNFKGEWIVTADITPGFKNNEEGRNEYLSSSKGIMEPSTLVISEFLPSNEGNVMFNGDKLYGYIEVTNEGDTSVNLTEYYLSNDPGTIYKWHLPEVVLEPNQSYLIFTNNINADNNANFTLKHHAGTVILANRYGILEQVDYEELTNGMAYIKNDNRWYQGGNISPGFPNTTSGKISYQEKYDKAPKSLLINEVMSSNTKFMPQNGNQFYDWVELYNNSSEPINLSEYTLTTDYNDRKMYTLPKVTLAPGHYYTLMASGDTSLSNGNYIHTNFKLSSGKGLLLYKDEQLVDSLYIYSIPRGSSYGRGNSIGHYYYSQPTPNAKNEDNGIREISYNPTFSKDGGIYNDVTTMEVKIEGNGTIYYTTDGSIPNKNSLKYTEPLYLNTTTVLKAVAYEKNKKNSEVVTNTYIINENHQIPVMSISLPESKFETIERNTYGHGTVGAHVELYEENSSFSIDCGFKLFGGQSRELAKKSYALKFNDTYSGSRLKYKVFPDKNIVEFNTLVLRSGSQDQNSSMIRDEFNSLLQVRYGTLDAQAVKPIVLYINGKYWGVYFIREKIDDDFIEDNYNVKGKTNIVNYKYQREVGSNSKFINLKNYILNSDMTIYDSFEYVGEELNLTNFADYWVFQYFLNSSDLHNIRYYYNNDVDKGKIRTIVYDTDYSLMNDYGSYYLSFIKNPSFLKAPPDTTILVGLMENDYFKDLFIQRIAYYTNHVWTKEHVEEIYNYLYQSIKPEMMRNCERWDLDYNHWAAAVERLHKNILSRQSAVKRNTKNYFKLTEEEYNEYFA